MVSRMFTEEERQLLEAHLINSNVDKEKIDSVLDQIKNQKGLFDDVFLYLQVKKTITT